MIPPSFWNKHSTASVTVVWLMGYLAPHLLMMCAQASITTSRVPFEGKSSVYVICMKYRIIVLIIIIISLDQIVLSYI